MSEIKELIKSNGIAIIPSFISPDEAVLIKNEAQFIFTQQIKLKGIHDGNFGSEKEYEQSVFKLFNEHYDSFIGAAKMAQHITGMYQFAFSEKTLELLKKAGMEYPFAATRPILNFNSKHTSKMEGHYKTPPHQDWRSMQGSLNSLVLWITLTDLPMSLGPVDFIPSSHKWGLLETQEDSWFRHIEDDRLTEDKWTTSTLKAGDAVLFSQFLVHRSGDNVTDNIRWSMQMRYNDALDKSFIERHYPHPFTAYKADQIIVTPGFPTPELLNDYYESI